MFFFYYTVFEWILVAFSIIILIPMLITVKNYAYTSLIEYLLISMVFLSASVNIFIIPVSNHIADFFLTKIQLISNFLQYIFLLNVIYHLKLKRNLSMLIILNLINFAGVFFLVFFQFDTPFIWDRIIGLILNLYVIFCGLLIIYVTFTEIPSDKTKNISKTVNIWKITGFSFLCFGIIGFLIWNEWIPLITIKEYFLCITIFYVFILGFMIFFYPKALLFNQVHIISAINLYKSVADETQKKNAKKAFDSIKSSFLMDYLKMIPKMLMITGSLFVFSKEDEILIKKVSIKGVTIAIILLFASLIDAIRIYIWGESLTIIGFIFTIQDVLIIGVGLAFLFPLFSFRKVINPRKKMHDMVDEMFNGLENMVFGFKIMIFLLVLAFIVEILIILALILGDDVYGI